MARNKPETKDNKRPNKSKQQHNAASGKRPSKKAPSKDSKDSAKINYVLHPRLLKKKIEEQKHHESREKLKSIQTKKRKRNAAFMKTTDKGQPKLNARMKVLYDQIARSYGKT